MGEPINATLEIGYFDARDARSDVPAQVTLDAHGMTLVAPDAKGESILWHGERRGQGHYILHGADARMDGSLHRFADSVVMEGFWRAGLERGFWRLHLPVDAVIPAVSRLAPPRAAAVKPRARPPKPVRRRVRRAA
jgi:hypothetical protein